MKTKINRNFHVGQMLIEIVIAIGIIGLVLVGVSDLMTRSVRVVSFQKQKEVGLEIIKKMLSDYKAVRDADPNGFYNTIANTVIDPCVATNPDFRCIVTVEKSVDEVAMSIEAEWQDGGRTYSVTLAQSLAKNLR